jgi:hypothetical protein
LLDGLDSDAIGEPLRPLHNDLFTRFHTLSDSPQITDLRPGVDTALPNNIVLAHHV